MVSRGGGECCLYPVLPVPVPNINMALPLFSLYFQFRLSLPFTLHQIQNWQHYDNGNISLYCRIRLVILGDEVGNTTDPVLVMGENRGGYGCKDRLYRVEGLWAMGVRH